MNTGGRRAVAALVGATRPRALISPQRHGVSFQLCAESAISGLHRHRPFADGALWNAKRPNPLCRVLFSGPAYSRKGRETRARPARERPALHQVGKPTPRNAEPPTPSLKRPQHFAMSSSPSALTDAARRARRSPVGRRVRKIRVYAPSGRRALEGGVTRNRCEGPLKR